MTDIDQILRATPSFRRLSAEDRQRVASVARVRQFARGETVFAEGEPSDFFYSVATGRVKVVKMLPSGKEVILEVFGAGEPLGAVAVYEGRPFPASAITMEETACILIPRTTFFSLLEQYPTLVRGILTGLTLRLIELTKRLAELSGGRVEARFARLFLKLAQDIGRPHTDGAFVGLPLSRQELADMTGTTIETCIRIMSRWGKDDIVRTEKDGFVVIDTASLEAIANA
ncbi:MAG: Crp/Fnr family transcriptional regulator [Acidobacteria bacterium]|nr:Crp/Fnr family transcriptional regulator [Acidobacteriota bacterium]